VVGDVPLELRLLLRRRQLALQQEIGHLHEVAVLGQLLDRVAAIKQLALVAVDVGDLRLAAPGRGVAGVEGEVAGLGVQLADVDDLRADAAADQRQLVASAGLVVGEGDRLGPRAGLVR